MPTKSPCRFLTAAMLLAVAAGCPTFSDDVQRDEINQEPAAAVEPGPDDPDAPEEFTTTDSGLKYRILRKGDGETPELGDSVRVHYRGWLDDGTEFDSSYARGEPAVFPLREGGLIDGWVEGLQYVSEGGKIELEIPPHLGYGESGNGPIPPNATLHFIVELESVIKR